jgi:hypothetical protein
MFRAGGIPRGMPLLGSSTRCLLADISEFQPDLHDAAYLAWSKAIIIRAMYGDAHDDRAWFGGARRAALHAGGVQFLGLYQYLVAGQDAAAQAHALVDLLGPLRPGEVPICDLEEGDGNQASRYGAWRAVVVGAYPQLKDTPLGGPLLYSGLNFAATHGLRPDWVAAYQSTAPAMPHVLWQFSASFQVPGVGIADCSVYLGTVADLRALVTPKSRPAPRPDPQPAPTPVPEDEPMNLDTTIPSHPLLIDFGTKTLDLLSVNTEGSPLEVTVTFLNEGAKAKPYTLSWGTADTVGSGIEVPAGIKKARIDIISGGGLPLGVRFNQ